MTTTTETEATAAPSAMTLEAMAREFHRALRVHAGFAPEQPTAAVPVWLQKLRQALLDEEVQELRDAVAARDVMKIADALGDIAYVIGGTAVTYGIPLDAVLAEVHRSNMTKTNTPAEAKLAKGPGYEPPDIAGVLARKGEAPAGIREYRIYVDEDGDGIRMHGPCAETIGCLFGRLFDAYPSMREDISLGQVIDAALEHEREKERLHADQLRAERECGLEAS